MNCHFNNCFCCPYPDCIIHSQYVRPKPRKTDKVNHSMETKREIDKRRLDDAIRGFKALYAVL